MTAIYRTREEWLKASSRLLASLEPILAELEEKQAAALIACMCDDCGYTAFTTEKWIDAGLPICPSHGPMTAHFNLKEIENETI